MLTVLIPTNNGAKTLPEVLGAYCDILPPEGGWSLVVIDNNSTDETRTVVSSFVGRLPVVYIFEPTAGKNAALNAGLTHVRGDVAVFSDDDSVPRRDWLVRMRVTCDSNPEFSIFAGRVIPRWPKTTPDWILNWVPLDRTFTVSDPQLREGPIAPGYVFGPNMAVRKAIFDAGHRFCVNIGPNGKSYPMGSETEFALRLVRAGCRCWYCPHLIVEHIISPEHLKKSWILHRAMLFGRGRIRLEPPPCLRRHPALFGVPRYLVRRLIEASIRTICSVASGDRRQSFQARWELNCCWGQVVEAHRLRNEQDPDLAFSDLGSVDAPTDDSRKA